MFDINQKVHPRVRVSKNKISDALFLLLKEKSIEDIIIADIIEATKDKYGVGIGRQTFYAHYNSKLDVIEDYFLDFYRESYNKIKEAKNSGLPLGMDLSIKCIHIIFNEFQPVKHKIKKILDNNHDDVFISHLNSIGTKTAAAVFNDVYRKIFGLVEDNPDEKTLYDTIICMSSASIAAIFSKWLTGEYSGRLDNIIEYVSRYNLAALLYTIAMDNNPKTGLDGFIKTIRNLDYPQEGKEIQN